MSKTDVKERKRCDGLSGGGTEGKGYVVERQGYEIKSLKITGKKYKMHGWAQYYIRRKAIYSLWDNGKGKDENVGKICKIKNS